MRNIFNIIIILVVLSAFGAMKLEFEDNLNHDMVEAEILNSPLNGQVSRKLGQTGAAVALGGMRSLVAAVWNMRAFVHFENLDWHQLEQSYEIIANLQPHTTHYWETGAWHLHTNASVYYKNKKELSPRRRNSMRLRYIRKGTDFLEEGIRQNPDDWSLHLALAKTWGDQHKVPDYARSLSHYEDVLACDSLPAYKRSMLRRFTFYTMTRVPGREKEAYALGVELFTKSDQNRLPNLVCCLFALQNALNIPESERIQDEELFPDKKREYLWLVNYWKHREQGYLMVGVPQKIGEIEVDSINQP